MEKRMVENSVPKRHYTAEFKTEAVSLAQSVGQYQAVRLLGVSVATLGNWTRRQYNLEATSVNGAVPATPAERPASQMDAEITRLRQELASAKPISRFFEKRQRNSQRSRSEVRMDRYLPQLLQRQPALPDAWRFRQRLLSMAQPRTKRPVASQRRRTF